MTRPRLVIRDVATATRGKGRVKPRKAQMETYGDVKTLADLDKITAYMIKKYGKDAKMSG